MWEGPNRGRKCVGGAWQGEEECVGGKVKGREGKDMKKGKKYKEKRNE